MTDVFPGGWRKGDTCYLITSRARRIAAAHTVESFDGRYFGVRGNSGLFHHVSPGRMFRSKEDAVASLEYGREPPDDALKRKKGRER
jgi:hypothetical protein